MERARNSFVPVAAGSGLVALDILVKANDSLPVEAYAGGTCGNVLSILAYLGWSSYPIARIGNDPAAATLCHDLRRFGVCTDFVLSDDRDQTPIIVQRNKLRPTGEVSHKFIWQCPSCGSHLPSFRPLTKTVAANIASRIPSPNVFVFDRVSPGTLSLAEALGTAGAFVAFEPSGIADPKLFERAVRASHMVKYSVDRLDAVPIPRDHIPRLEVQTLGKEGLRYRSTFNRRWRRLEALPADLMRDTSGAGDWCTAGILSTLACGGTASFPHSARDVEHGIRFGQALAALNCAYEGARGLMYRISPSDAMSAAGKLIDNKDLADLNDAILAVVQEFTAAFCSSCWDRVSDRSRAGARLALT